MSIRITRRHRRVLDTLAVSEHTVASLVAATRISPQYLWPVIDKLTDEGWIASSGHDTYMITDKGRDGLKNLPPAHVGKTHRRARR